MKVSAIIFDLDGTVVNDENVYAKSFRNILIKYGVKNPPAFPHESGIGVAENWRNFRNKYNLKTEKTDYELANETQLEYTKMISKVKLRKGFKQFIDQVRDSGIQTALATSNNWNMVEKIYDKFGIEEYFGTTTTAEELHSNKPDPEIFLLTADKLNVQPDECLVIEDSPAGIDAAQRADMKVVAIYRNKKHKKELDGADLVVSNFKKISPQKLLNL